jgi:ribosomal protein S15P/S13E
MGWAADEIEVEKYAAKIGVLITLMNSLDHDIQIFIEAILEAENHTKTNANILSVVRGFEFSKRLNFLKSLIKTRHADRLNDYLKIHDDIIKSSEVRNKFAHSQVYFWDDPDGTHMMVSNIKKIDEYVTENMFDQIAIEYLEELVKNCRHLISKFNNFTYELGYFQG